MGFGLSSPKDGFKLLYLAQDTRTAIAETIIRDRFQSKAKRELPEEEFDDYSIAAIRNGDPLVLVDLRREEASLRIDRCGRARAQRAGRKLSQELYDRTVPRRHRLHVAHHKRECVAVYDRSVSKLDADAPALDLSRLRSLTADPAIEAYSCSISAYCSPYGAGCHPGTETQVQVPPCARRQLLARAIQQTRAAAGLPRQLRSIRFRSLQRRNPTPLLGPRPIATLLPRRDYLDSAHGPSSMPAHSAKCQR